MRLRRIRPNEAALIRKECGRFIRESGGLPLIKNLPRSYEDFKRVKVRKKKSADDSRLNEIFGEALGVDLYRSTMFASGRENLVSPDSDLEPFYVFPVDKYKFLYSSEIKNTSLSYGELIDELSEEMSDVDAEQTIKELLRLTYIREDLELGIKSGAEIVFFEIPRYYAVRKSIIGSYHKFYGDLSCS